MLMKPALLLLSLSACTHLAAAGVREPRFGIKTVTEVEIDFRIINETITEGTKCTQIFVRSSAAMTPNLAAISMCGIASRMEIINPMGRRKKRELVITEKGVLSDEAAQLIKPTKRILGHEEDNENQDDNPFANPLPRSGSRQLIQVVSESTTTSTVTRRVTTSTNIPEAMQTKQALFDCTSSGLDPASLCMASIILLTTM